MNKIFVILIIINIGISKVYASSIKVSFTSIGDVFHLEFSGKSFWNYKLQKIGKNKYKLQVPQINEKSLIELKAAKNPYLKDIKIEYDGPDKSQFVYFTFSSNIIESFDYQTDEPSRLIIDFYENKNKKKALSVDKDNSKIFVQKDKKIKELSLSKVYKKLNKKNRSPSGTEFMKASKLNSDKELTLDLKRGVYDSDDPDYERFKIKDYEIKEEAIIASKQNVYIKFPMLKMGVSFLNKIINNSPDYRIKPMDSIENKEARFLLTLFNNQRKATYLKTYEYFKNKYSDSVYIEILAYMAADIHFKLWMESKNNFHFIMAKKIYNKVLKENKNSLLEERTNLLLYYAELEQGKSLETIQNFLRIIKNSPKSKEMDRAKLALAEGYFMLNKYDAALDVYENLEKNKKEKIYGIEATYRKGDVQFKKNEYKKAIENYSEAIKNYPKYEYWFANANYNIAESYFWLGDYKKSLDHYVRYIRLFPRDNHNSYAMTRIGEVLEILGANKSKIKNAFLESYFRFENTPGAKIARVRLLAQQMSGMKKKELSKTLIELGEISKSVKLPKMEEFTTLMITDGYRNRKDYDKAISQLIKYYQKNPTTVSLDFFKTRIVGNIADSINEKIINDNYFEALKISGRYEKTWLRNSDRIDVEYFKGKAFELAGVFSEAKIKYKKVFSRLEKIKGTREHLIRKVSEHIPSIDTITLRLANTNLNLRKYSEAFQGIRKVFKSKKLTETEKIEMIEISSKIYIKKNLISKAKKNIEKLVKTWSDQPDLVSSAYLQLAELQLKTQDYKKSEISSQKVIDLVEYKPGKFDEMQKKLSKALELKGLSLIKQGKKMSGVEVYLDLLNKYDLNLSLGSIRYKAGEILFKKNDIKGAEKVWSLFNAKEDGFFKKLAEEKLTEAKWVSTYKRYNDRIPAMSNFK